PNSPDDKAHGRRHNHADKEVRIEHDRHAVRLLGPVDTSPSANMAFPGPDEDPRRPVQPGSGTDLGDGLARGVGAGAPAAVFVSGLGGLSKSRMTGVKGSTRPPAKPRSPSRRTSDSCKPPPTKTSRSSPSTMDRSAGSGPSSDPRRRRSITQIVEKPIPRNAFATSGSSTCISLGSRQTTWPSQSRHGR